MSATLVSWVFLAWLCAFLSSASARFCSLVFRGVGARSGDLEVVVFSGATGWELLSCSPAVRAARSEVAHDLSK